MDSSFHFYVSNSFPCCVRGYHRKVSHTIRPPRPPLRAFRPAIAVAASIAVILITICPIATFAASGATAAPPRISTPAKFPRAPTSGFAPDGQTLFAPIVYLAPPGPARASRAIAILNRQLDFQRKISFHPKLAPALQEVVDLLPPRQSTMIRAAALYSKPAIPWRDEPDGTHQICVTGRPSDDDYLYTLSPDWRSPEEPARFSGVFGLKPSADSTPANISSVTGTLAGELMIDTYGIGALVDACADALREVHGDLRPPWDSSPGAFNHHDRAALDKFHRQMPHLAAKFDHYFKFNNLLDEFNSPAGPIVLLNVDAEVRQDALRKYPLLYDFYRKVVPAVTATSVILDSHGNFWMREAFDHGHIRVTVMIRGGLLTPFNAAMQPAGGSIALNEIARGSYRTLASAQVTSLAMNFGLANVEFATDYRRDLGSVTFVNRMDAVPQLIAPPGVHQVMDLIAGDFLRALATGNGGMNSNLTSRRLPNGIYDFSGGVTAQLNYSPTLELLARIGDAIATKHNDRVRAEERAFGEELFDAFVADYNDARPAIIALDLDKDKQQEKSK
ncbi:hypothetical protein [Candidatus Binatus soli]|jgi:hypothetical protein|uniref:hypothetical protein n=1 Tax=Candidatus Binatus soli TaxID=1953413 RepID=UPI003D0E1B4D